MKYYIKRGLWRAAVFSVALSNAGTTEQDYRENKWMEITEQQADFYKQNSYASFSEIKNMALNHIYTGDALKVLKSLPSESVDCVVTSPPYYLLRD